MTTYSHESVFEDACHNGQIPGAVLVAADATGKFRYAKAFGKTAFGETLSTDSVMWLASCTKLMTAVAALQQVERGHIGLDEDIDKILPELAALQVLEGFDDEGNPIYQKRDSNYSEAERSFCTRHLLSHSSGLAYPMTEPKLQQLATKTDPSAAPPRTIVAEFSTPLFFQPGQGWVYGSSCDWAGKIVERLSGLPLEDYMRANIWDPLGMEHISFAPNTNPEMQACKVGMSLRDESGKLVPTTEGYLQQFEDRNEAYGGAASWGSAEAYLRLLQCLCAGDGRVLGKSLVDEMFRPQLGPEAKESMNHAIRTIESQRRIQANSFDMRHQVLDHGLGGEIGLRDEVGRRLAGTMSWGGLPNLIWWIDRKAGLCGAYFSQLVPPGDTEVNKLEAVFERAIYEQYEKFRSDALVEDRD
ncbi:beta-lactamase family protein [Whalleya microplaca]|nr:beta-lactamase family protein [Whalleya microplaca]